MGVDIWNTLDRLDDTFTIFDTGAKTVVLPVGEYQYRRYGVNYHSDGSRAISGHVGTSGGTFWSGHDRALGGGIQFKPSYHVNVELTWHYDNVKLREGDFITKLIGARVLYAFTSRMFFNAFVQYNSTANEFSANTRFNVIHRPLSDLFVVYNERRNTDTGALIDRGLAVKFTNMFDF
jgi:hypothetical protein